MPVDPKDQLVDEHYGRGNLTGRILEALRDSGKDPKSLDAEDLSPIDHFHTGGRRATLILAHLAGITSGMRVLDVGGGLGGPARALASEFGCTVEVLDITQEFCRAGEMLTKRTGLGDLVSFRYGSALEMPYPDASFDFVWTQHSSMNIADKERLYQEIHRVLRPGGSLAMHEIMAGPNSPPLSGPVGARTGDQPPPAIQRNTLPPRRYRLQRASVGGRNRICRGMVPETVPREVLRKLPALRSDHFDGPGLWRDVSKSGTQSSGRPDLRHTRRLRTGIENHN